MFTCENGRCINKVSILIEHLLIISDFCVFKDTSFNSFDVFFRVGLAIMIMIVEMVPMKGNSAIHCTNRARLKNSRARTSNAFEISIVATVSS